MGSEKIEARYLKAGDRVVVIDGQQPVTVIRVRKSRRPGFSTVQCADGAREILSNWTVDRLNG